MDTPSTGSMYQRHSGQVYQSVENRTPWRTGHFRRLPWIGFLSVLGSLLGIAACAAVLVYSDQKPVLQWKFQPTVYIAIAATLTNIFLAVALSEGADIAWWRKASSEKTTVADLHRLWNHGQGFKSAVAAGRNISLVAIACIFATLAQINSPLLQRASTVVLSNLKTDTQVSFRAASTLPNGYTGYISGRAYTPSQFTNLFAPVALAWNTNASIPTNATGCTGTCDARVSAAGLSVNCSTFTIPFSMIPEVDSSGSLNVTDQAVQGVYAFLSTIAWSNLGDDGTNGGSKAGNMTITVTYKKTADCAGDLIVEQCSLQTAKVLYPVTINGNKSTIALKAGSSVFDDQLQSITPISPHNTVGAATLAGYVLALTNAYNSSVNMRFTGAVGYTILPYGNLASQYVVNNDPDSPYMNCSTSFQSPLSDILQGARDLMFRTAIAASDATSPLQTVDATQIGVHAIYESNYYYLGGAVAITLLAIIFVLTIFRGYADLGRSTSMSPIEIAKAFNAPILQSHDGNAEADELISEVGKRSIRYGAVADQVHPHHGMFGRPGMGVSTEYKPYDPHVHEITGRRRLIIAEERQVAVPADGETFSG